MKLRTHFVTAALVAGLAACASAPVSTNFSATSGKALIVIAAPVDGSNNVDVFRRVDLATNAFVDKPVVFDVKTYGGLDTLFTKSNQINAGASDRTVALAIMEVAAGDYARVESFRTSGSANFGWAGRLCLNEMSPVYSVAAGEIAVIRVDQQAIQRTGNFDARWRPSSNAPSDASVLEQFQRARANYPAIVGEAKLQGLTALIRWPQTSPSAFALRGCAEPAGFERIAATQP